METQVMLEVITTSWWIIGNGFNSVAGQEAQMTHNRPRPSVGLHLPDILNRSEKYLFYLKMLSVAKVK
jgi:hypothetical protein